MQRVPVARTVKCLILKSEILGMMRFVHIKTGVTTPINNGVDNEIFRYSMCKMRFGTL